MGPLQLRLKGSLLFIWQLLVEYLPCARPLGGGWVAYVPVEDPGNFREC